jgi:transcription elongation factor Elf1
MEKKEKLDKIEKEYVCLFCSTPNRKVKFKKIVSIKDGEPYNNHLLCPFCGNGVKQ